jgi:Microsomal signal peptidase 25 kDa subunit (SPC25)
VLVRLTCKYLQSLDYVQDHTFTDVHLALGYLAVIFVAAAAAYEYKIGFKDAKGVSILSVGSYFILQGALYCWTNYIVRDIVYIGKKGELTVYSLLPPSGKVDSLRLCALVAFLVFGSANLRQIEISTSVRKYDPTYNTTLRLYKKSEITNVANVSAKKAFADWFDEEGTFVKKPFDNWLSINIIEAEKKLVAAKSKKRN